ncbi:MAG: Na+/H+ antiporter NhaA [Mucilaginibacter sp.]|nr:Na+/H+ antiporter NhaA [Mucilaginibacter sp.]
MKITNFLKSESLSGIVLIVCVIVSLIIANSPGGTAFQNVLDFKIAGLSILNWINDGLMAIFFFLIGLEIKHEMLDGHLSTFKKAAVPVFAAVGGALVPAAIYACFNIGTPGAKGWGIPMATDIAFALGVLSLLGKIVPPALKAFLSALAVVDDLLAIIVIAIFYAAEIHWLYLAIAAGIFVLLLLMNKLGVKRAFYFIIPGIIMWYFIHHSGVHATVAGVLTALAVPNKAKNGSPLQKLAHGLTKPVNYIIMPLFALANTDIRFTSEMLEGVGGVLSLGIIIGLVAGKPLGVMLASWLSVKTKIGKLPDGFARKHILGIGLLAGIGFTMSIFMSFLSFGNSTQDAQSKLAIMLASLIAGSSGYVYLKNKLSVKAKPKIPVASKG